MSHRSRLILAMFLVPAALAWWGLQAAVRVAPGDVVQLADKQFRDGNVKDAYESYRRALLSVDFADRADEPLHRAVECLQRLGRTSEVDALLEDVVEAHAKHWRIVAVVARQYLAVQHDGFIVAGKFERGGHRGGGEYANSFERDRIRALQLLMQVRATVDAEATPTDGSAFYLQVAEALRSYYYTTRTWQLQALTDLRSLPDYVRGYGYGESDVGAPVDADGNPIFYAVPSSWDDATTDGARWRWALRQAASMDPARRREAESRYASFLNDEFGVQTMGELGYRFGGFDADDDAKNRPQTFALHTLADEETIARLATGIKRFKLPDEHNPIKIWKNLADGKGPEADDALDELGTTYENRRQYARAAEIWRDALARFPLDGRFQNRKRRLDQIVANWGRFDGGTVQPAGQGATLDLRYRNAKSAEFTAHALKVDLLLADLKKYLQGNPQQIDWQKINLDQIGYRLVEKNEKQYVGELAASWKLALDPLPGHFDRRISVTTPLEKAGAYLVTAKLADGNTSRIIVWLADTVIVKKPLDGKSWIYVADAVSGQPVAKANVELFGYRQRHLGERNDRPQWTVDTVDVAEFTDVEGQIAFDRNDDEQYNWLIVARTNDGRLAHLGFTNLWRARRYDADYDETKTYGITDRPVYRPSQAVKFKFWIRQARYDRNDDRIAAGTPLTLELLDPQGTSIWKTSLKSDSYGGINGEYELPSDAKLGNYQLSVINYGGLSFRVEEYKKPEFAVTVDAPAEPVRLGDKITATLEAKYYFGAPVTTAKVKYKVLRTEHEARWFPPMRWDWLYGRGYWWFAYDYPWYPGWRSWGCLRPIGWWWPQSHNPPEVVAERETEIGPEGKLKIEIDTALAKELHGDQDHRYEISAEVTDQSRRTIVGSGQVLVARKPFRVFTWVDRGHYRAGDTIEAEFSAHTLSDKPVQGKGKLRLLSILYDADGEPTETLVQEWDVDTNAEGRARQQLQASAAGQFRLSYELTDAAGRVEEGGYVFTVTGEGFDGAQFRFAGLELIPDKREYVAGQTVRLMVNTDRVGSTVLLFVRPANGVYLPPRFVRLNGKSTVVELGVTVKDMPNFFVEGLTIADGSVYSETKELVVPPESRVADVSIKPSKTEYRPGEKARLELTLRDAAGRAFVGQTVVAVYDKAVEYISGGSNVPDIKEFFWKWRRHHHPQTESSLDQWFYNLTRSDETTMSDIGVFGATVADDAELDKLSLGQDKRGEASRYSFEIRTKRQRAAGLGGGGFGMANGAVLSAAAAAPMAADALAEKKDRAAPLTNMPNVQENAAVTAVQPTVRTNFADTALWVAALETNSDGVAQVDFTMPENLSTWKVRTWAMGRGTNVGETSLDVVTTKKLIVRLQAPRFFVERDEVVLSANVHNYLKSKKQVRVELQLEGPTLTPLDASSQNVEVPAEGEARVDWRVKVVAEGEAVVRMRALTDEESDAVEQKFPSYVHGMLKTESFAGALRRDDTVGKLTFDVPNDRRVEQSRLEVRFSPTLAGAMVDALPYLADYPYGCTEQTLNRFLPTVVTQKVLRELGLDLKAIHEKRSNLNAQELGDVKARAEQWKRFDRNPVFNDATVTRMVKAGVERLTAMQCGDGGWGWFSGWGEHSYPHTTAYVVHGLQIASQNDVALVPGVLERGVEWLERYQGEQVRLLKNAVEKKTPSKARADELDAFVFMVLADAERKNADLLVFLERDRPQLSVYALAMYGAALHKLGEADKLKAVMTNLSQYVVEDDENQTAYLRLPENNYWWYWYGSDNEAMAYYLKLLARVEPHGRTASRLVKYLLNNRKHGTYWRSTRDTSLCVEALADYLRASGESKPDLTLEIRLDGAKRKEVKIDAGNLFYFDNAMLLEGDELSAGRHTLELRKVGVAPLYYNAFLTNFSTEDFITKVGLEVKVDRKFYRLVREDAEATVAGARGQAVSQKVERYRRDEIPNLAVLKSGDLVDVELEIESKNDYEYLMFEDMKAAGFEPVDLQSGYNGNALGAYMELRDERVCFFSRVLPRGRHSVAYRLRAEIPGKFSALPTRVSAMYASELKANSDEMKIGIQD